MTPAKALPCLAAFFLCSPASAAPRPAGGGASSAEASPQFMRTPPPLGPVKPFKAPPRERFRLSNGLEVVLVQDRRFPRVAARLAVRGGTALAGEKDAGLVEAMAELLTAGTSSHTARDIAEAADAFGGEVGARADHDHLILSGEALSDKAGPLFDLLGELAVGASFPEGEVELRKANMASDLKVLRSDPLFLAEISFHRLLFGDHPYAVLSPSEDSIARIEPGKLRSLHRRLFVPSNAVLVVAGDASREALSAALESAFGAWKLTGEPTGPPLPAPRRDGARRRAVLADRPGSAQTALFVGSLAPREDHPDYFKLLLANQVLGGSFGARLTTLLRERKGYTYGIGSRLLAMRSAGVFRIRTEVRSDATGPAIAAVLAEMERLRGEPPSAAEMRQAANSLCGAFVLDLETLEGLAEAVLYGLLQDLPEDRLDTFVGKVQAVTARQAQEAARAYLDPGGVSIAAAGDAGKIQEALAGFSAEPVARVDQNGREMRNP